MIIMISILWFGGSEMTENNAGGSSRAPKLDEVVLEEGVKIYCTKSSPAWRNRKRRKLWCVLRLSRRRWSVLRSFC